MATQITIPKSMIVLKGELIRKHRKVVSMLV